MSEQTFEEMAISLQLRLAMGDTPSKEEMFELLALAVKEAERQIPTMISDTAEHIRHGDDKVDMIDAISYAIDHECLVAGAALAAILIHHLATLQISGVDVSIRENVNV
jgi:hypothetical protein